jgi:hypothetical protein
MEFSFSYLEFRTMAKAQKRSGPGAMGPCFRFLLYVLLVEMGHGVLIPHPHKRGDHCSATQRAPPFLSSPQ